MKFWDIFSTSKNIEKRDKIEYISPWSDALLFAGGNVSSSNMALSAVNRAVTIISDSIAVMPVKIMNKSFNHIQEVPNHQVKNALNGVISEYTLKSCLIRDVLLNGNGYAYISRDASGNPIEVIYCPASTVTCNYNETTFDLYYQCTNVSNMKISPEDMIHLKKYTKNGVNGISVVSYAARAIDTAAATEEQANEWFSSGCNVQGVLSVNGQLSEKQREAIRLSWDQAYGKHAKGVAILQANMTYTPVSVNANDAQLLESRKFNVEDIARFFGIPAIMLTGAQANNLEAAQNQFLLHCLAGWVEMFEQEFSNKLFPKGDYKVVLDPAALMRTDKQALANYYNTLLQNGVLCINEVRNELGLAGIEGGDKHIIPYTDINQNTLNSENVKDNQI